MLVICCVGLYSWVYAQAVPKPKTKRAHKDLRGLSSLGGNPGSNHSGTRIVNETAALQVFFHPSHRPYMRPVRGHSEISRLYWIMYKIYRFMQMRAKILTCFSVAEL